MKTDKRTKADILLDQALVGFLNDQEGRDDVLRSDEGDYSWNCSVDGTCDKDPKESFLEIELFLLDDSVEIWCIAPGEPPKCLACVEG